MQDTINLLWEALHYEFQYYGITFTLYDVFLSSCFLTIIGVFIKDWFLFQLNPR